MEKACRVKYDKKDVRDSFLTPHPKPAKKDLMDRIGILKNAVMDYPWGSTSFIRELVGDRCSGDTPQAELWMGAHPKAPSELFWNGRWQSLLELIRKHPEAILGKAAAERFSNQMPFLFKVLAASKPLSLQAHPGRVKAREGYAREIKRGIPPDARKRNYKDENHKPELFCALTEFWALKGFRKADEIFLSLDRIGSTSLEHEWMRLQAQKNEEGSRRLFQSLIKMDLQKQQRIVDEVIACIQGQPGTDPVFEWVLKLHQAFPKDIGVLLAVFLNHVRLEPGEAVFIMPGELHAYLDGAGVELMANSDNVLRGGLTTKYVDVDDLLATLDFTYGKPEILSPIRNGTPESIYPTPVEEFLLSEIVCSESLSFLSPQSRNVEVIICAKGQARITDLVKGEAFTVNRGTTVLIPASVRQYRLEGAAKLYKATVPH